jgi:hypothetical protein
LSTPDGRGGGDDDDDDDDIPQILHTVLFTSSSDSVSRELDMTD